jgi:DNA modification methylase
VAEKQASQGKFWNGDNGIQERLGPISEIRIMKQRGVRTVVCFCGAKVERTILPHIREKHSETWNSWKSLFVEMRNQKWSHKRIMNLFRVNGGLLFTWAVIEKELLRMEEEGEAELEIWQKQKIERWQPEHFEPERTTVWNFSRRGDWAVHQSDYRGNWPPQLVRNLLLAYTLEGDLTVDLFAGGGTSLIEAWLTGRKGLGIDINKFAVKTMQSRLSEMLTKSRGSADAKLDPDLHPIVVKGDSRCLDQILSEQHLTHGQVKLFLAHPPYLDALRYSSSEDSDLSRISDVEKFCEALRVIAEKARPWMKEDGVLALLIGDTRKHSKLIPLGFRVLNEFLESGYTLKEVIIKTQNQDLSTNLWSKNDSLKFLIAHEYLFIFSNNP